MKVSFWKIEIEVKKEVLAGLEKLSLMQKKTTPELISQAIGDLLTRNGISTRPEDPELSKQITAFALAAEVDRDKFIVDLRESSEDKFRGEYPLVASGPTLHAPRVRQIFGVANLH